MKQPGQESACFLGSNYSILLFCGFLDDFSHHQVLKHPCVLIYELVTWRAIPVPRCLLQNQLPMSADFVSHRVRYCRFPDAEGSWLNARTPPAKVCLQI